MIVYAGAWLTAKQANGQVLDTLHRFMVEADLSIEQQEVRPALRLRWLTGPHVVFRIQPGWYVSSDVTSRGPDDQTQIRQKQLRIGVGVEDHIGSTAVCSPYWGGSAEFVIQNREEDRYLLSTTATIPFVGEPTLDSSIVTIANYSGVDAKLFAGVDVQVVPRCYVGAEVSASFNVITQTAGSVLTRGPSSRQYEPVRDDGSISAFGLGTAVVLRMGWRF